MAVDTAPSSTTRSRLDNLGIAAGSFQRNGISLQMPSGACTVLMGPSGSGKTTLLETLCGLRPATSGQIFLNGQDVTDLPPRSRRIGYLPQDSVLFQHLTVAENIAFGLRSRKRHADAEISERVTFLAERLEIKGLLDRKPLGLSGGEMKRVALGRALAFRPDLICLDEPLSALDSRTRDEVSRLLEDVIAEEKVPVLMITHSREDAERFGDELVNW